MPWTYRFDERALKELRRLDRQIQKEIITYFDKRVAGLSDPRRFGKALTGSLSGLWRFRVRDYRIVCRIENREMVVLVLAVGHRKDVYR